MNVSAQMLAILHHTLGLAPECRVPYRNHYVAGDGHHSMQELEALEQSGLMARARTPKFCDHDDIVFVCTDTGKEYAIDNLPPEQQRPKRSNYSDYVDADYGHSFADWLNINKPEFDMQYQHGRYEYRMFRRNRLYTWGSWGAVSGKWAPTKKEAKASYKAALQAFRNGKGCDPLRGLI